jgi:purine-nucleoside phosphorylase
MGKWAKELFGKSTFGKVGIVVAGTISPDFEKKLLGFFDRVISSRDAVYHAHLGKKKGVAYPIVFNVYGAPAMVDLLTEMHDGGCRIVIFVGYAYGGFKNLDVGSIVIPDKSYHFDGIYHPIQPDRRFDVPDQELKKKLEELFNKANIKHVGGTNISVPAVTFQMPHANKKYQKINPSTVEMELSACLSRAKDIGIRAVGILIISDNRSISIGDATKKKLRYSTKTKVIKTIIENIYHFNILPLKTEKEFNIDEHLASIIEDSNDKTNVYRKKP